MATDLRIWLGVLGASCATIAFSALPPEPYVARRGLPEDVHYREVTAELQLAHGILMARRWSDSLSALAVETAVDGLALGHPPSELVTPADLSEWRELLSSRLDSLQPRDPDMVVGWFIVDDRHASLDGVLLPRFGVRTQTYVGVRADTPYCITVQPERYAIDNRTLRNARTLESCRFHAKYGMPGPQIAAWLEKGGFTFASDASLASYEPIFAFMRENRPPTVPSPFGLDRIFTDDIDLARCLADRIEACALTFAQPRPPAGGGLQPLIDQSPISFIRFGTSQPILMRNSVILAELEARYGPEAFERFWSSRAEVPEAFEAAFRADPGAWMREWIQAEGASYRAGAMPSAGSVWWTLLTFTALSALVTVVATRRRVA